MNEFDKKNDSKNLYWELNIDKVNINNIKVNNNIENKKLRNIITIIK